MSAGTGGYAFPGGGGMWLRDYFAAQALTGVLQARALLNGPDSLGSQEDVAEECYELADAMLARRAGRLPPEDEHHVSITIEDAVALCFLVQRAITEPGDATAADVAAAGDILHRLRAAVGAES